MSKLSWMEACIRRLCEYGWISDGLAEDLRQWALEQDLGQVKCHSAHSVSPGIDRLRAVGGWKCPGCGAAL